MSKFCCFLCPNKDYADKALEDLCPSCGRAYGFPLVEHPKEINDYHVITPRGRGFYAATYLCQRGRLNKRYILKVSPVSLYTFFDKVFEKECQIHSDVAVDSEHIVGIDDYFDSDINFNGTIIKCHVAVIDFVDGIPLDGYLSSKEDISARSIAQISIDLFRIWREFSNKLRYHNDLHAENIIIQHLREDARRAEAIDEGIRAVAIDLGSVSDKSKSDACDLRLGDQHWLCRHLQRMISWLREDRRYIDKVDDLDNRIAEALEKTVDFLLPAPISSRTPTPDQLIRMVRDNFSRTSSPWKVPLKLDRFDDSYNAGALEPWYVPFLLVDPDDLWIKRISAAGPLLITGMRGCGKTMLIRALDFHARAAQKGDESAENVLERLQTDNYVGLFVSCMSLLSMPGRSETPAALERLFCAYCLEAIRAIRHLQELDRSKVVPRYYESIAESFKTHMEVEFDIGEFHSDHDFERFLLRISTSLRSRTSENFLRSSPADAFVGLATAVRECSPVWSGARIFFLLDDVSTRYLREELIKTLFSSLLFQSPISAFKLTTEAQTLEMALYSPGLVERARAGRDYDVFDLGAEVYGKTKNRPAGNKFFIEQILERRANYYPNHPKETPHDILDDCPLEEIARRIATTNSSSRERKSAYFGMTALSAVCVGDIGDVISLYELILKTAVGQEYPVKPEVQSDCYQNFCSRRIYDLNRRESYLKDFAKTFAEASYELLVKSYRDKLKGKTKRIRQYASIYVRVTAGDTQKQFQRLRELIDAGIFVLDGGTPRTKTRDGDPVQQFKLTYRKLFGLSNFIGLAERDRFELSGEQLNSWLEHPEAGKEVLLRNLGIDNGSEDTLEESNGVDAGTAGDDGVVSRPMYTQQSLFAVSPKTVGDVFSAEGQSPSTVSCASKERLLVEQIGPKSMHFPEIRVIILGLGFEDRSLESAKRVISLTNASHAILIEYNEPGRSEQIQQVVSRKVREVRRVKYTDLLTSGLEIPKAPALIDVTGLAKPAIFSSIRASLQDQGQVWVCHTRAEEYYPLNSDIEKVLNAEKNQDQYQLLDSLSEILTGEKGPYSIYGLIKSEADESRRKVLCTFSSAKHQRLLSLLDTRDYDRIEIVVPPEGTPRSKIARIAAEIAAWNFQVSATSEIHSNEIKEVVKFLIRQYEHWYVARGYNMEFGLTGSKMQAVACAVVSVVCKIAQCWYVSPQEFDESRFTKGIGDSRYFKIRRTDS